MAIEFINEQFKKITYSEKSCNSIKNYIIKNSGFTVFFEMSDLVSKNAEFLFDFLQKHENGFVVVRNINSFEKLSQFNSIKTLVTENKADNIKKPKVDLSSFYNLTYLSTNWNPKIIKIGTLHNLKQFNLFHYKPKSIDLTELSTLNSLEKLKLGSGNYESLKGLDKLKNLKELRIYNNRFVKTDKTLIFESVEELYIDACKSFDNEFYKSFPNLKSLDLITSNPIESLKPILDNLKKLEQINVCETKILEEDNSYWKDYKNIILFNFNNRKHHKLKTKDFPNFPYDKDGKWKGLINY